MKTTKHPQAGIGHIAIVFAVVFLAVVGFAGWQVFSSNKNASVGDKASTASVQVPNKIQTKADLVQTSKALDSSSTNVNSNLNDNALNADLNDML
jgi:predicted negative regulator of RcsB-dependent stress response